MNTIDSQDLRVILVIIGIFTISSFALTAQVDKSSSQRHSSEVPFNPPNPGYCSEFGSNKSKTLDKAFYWANNYEKQNFSKSLTYWRYIFRHAPGYQESLHITGIKMYQDLIESTSNPGRRDRLIDTLLMIYDKRIECFGNRGYLLGRKGYELMKYRGQNYDEIRAYFESSIEIQGIKTEYFILYPYAKLIAYEYRKGNISINEVREVYSTIVHIADNNSGSEYNANYTKAKNIVTNYYVEIGVLPANYYVHEPNNKSISEESEKVKVIQMKRLPGGVYEIPCKLNGLPLKFILDTGASDVSISLSEAIFMLKNGYLTESDILGTRHYSLANGEIAEGTTIRIKKLEFGGLVLKNIEASIVHELMAPLLLGQSAITRLGKIQIDPENSTLSIID